MATNLLDPLAKDQPLKDKDVIFNLTTPLLPLSIQRETSQLLVPGNQLEESSNKPHKIFKMVKIHKFLPQLRPLLLLSQTSLVHLKEE
jgi:hypothetical protein